jgi:hypothetical protein
MLNLVTNRGIKHTTGTVNTKPCDRGIKHTNRKGEVNNKHCDRSIKNTK